MNETGRQRRECVWQEDLQCLREFWPLDDELMHDFSCTNADDMNFSLMAERTKYLKEDQEGIQEMSKILEDLRNETDLAARTEIARAFLLMEEFSYEKIAEGTKLPIEYIEELAGKDIF